MKKQKQVYLVIKITWKETKVSNFLNNSLESRIEKMICDNTLDRYSSSAYINS